LRDGSCMGDPFMLQVLTVHVAVYAALPLWPTASWGADG
jgi:hypothetical protein